MKNMILSGNALTRLAKPAALLLLSFSLLSAAPAQAAGDKGKEVPVEVKYLGTPNGNPLFQIAINNPHGEELALSLRDDQGNLIYSDVIKDQTYTRNFRFEDLDADKLKLVLTLRAKKNVQTQSFEITRSTRTVEDVAVVNL